MKWNNLFIGFAVGFATSYLYGKKQQSLSSSDALSIVKQAFKKQGTIDGSWIHTTPKTLQKQGLSFEGYNGGIIRTIDNRQEHLEFFIDKKNGAILELKKL